MKDKILKHLGENKTDPVVLNREDLATHGVYTYQGDVYCLKDGCDFEFDSLKKYQQMDIVDEILAGRYKINPYFQG